MFTNNLPGYAFGGVLQAEVVLKSYYREDGMQIIRLEEIVLVKNGKVIVIEENILESDLPLNIKLTITNKIKTQIKNCFNPKRLKPLKGHDFHFNRTSHEDPIK